MSLNPLNGTEQLRFVDGGGTTIGEVDVIDGDKVDKTLSEVDIEVVEPVYGDPYIIVGGKQIARYTKGTLSFEAPYTTLIGLDNYLQGEVLPKVILKYGGGTYPEVVLLEGVLMSVYYTRDLSKGEESVAGQITFLNC